MFGLNVEGGRGEANEWDIVASETRRTISQLKEVDTKCSDIRHAVEDNGSGVLCDKILSTLQELDVTERTKTYLQWMRKINQIR